MAYRVAELAAAAGISVELVRSYQSKGLLEGPRREGRVALYGERHLERLRDIAALKEKGYSLKAIAGLVAERDRPRVAEDSRVTRALAAGPPVGDDEHLDLHDLSDRTRVPLAVLRSLEGSGVVRPRKEGEEGAYYTAADVRAVRMLLSLLGVGLPMEEFMRLATIQIAAMQQVAVGAVELYAKYVGEPLRASGLDPSEEEARSEAAFSLLVQAATSLVAYSFERTLRNAWASSGKSQTGRV
ncbi:MAG: MerR family transcriptional regulator [Acidimicrobiia bacterium]